MTRAILLCTFVWLGASPASACDTMGRLDVFDLAERADEVFVGRYNANGAFAVLETIEGQPDGETQLREGARVECAPDIEPGAVYLVFVDSDGAAVGAYRSAVRLSAYDDNASHPLVTAVRAWRADRGSRQRRAVLTALLHDAPSDSAREAAFALAQSGWWRPIFARRLDDARCREVRSALDDLNVEWNQRGLRRRVIRDFDRACPR